MEFVKMSNSLWITSSVFFDDETCFCGRPWISLNAYKEGCYGFPPYTISIAVHDNDDFSINLLYQANSNNFFDVLHEIINWMRDHEKGVSSYEKLMFNTLEFFPDAFCERKPR